jgi:hypothetical protein
MHMLSVSNENNNNNHQNILEINALSLFGRSSSSYFGEGPWIPQTPDSQQDTGPKELWQEEDEVEEE